MFGPRQSLAFPDHHQEEKRSPMTTQLCPAQQQAFDGVSAALPVGNVFLLCADTGMGKTTVLRELHRAAGGALLTMKDFVDASRRQHPLAMEEAFEQLV